MRGQLRIYLGAAPGVGKTCKMLQEGLRRLERGTDVVVGYVETHGRPYTAELASQLETLPRKDVEYRGTAMQEMDLDAILERRPEVVLVDELAHTNVPGSANVKRWQDVQVLLDAGIEVITTVNIQHIESLNDVTETITGVRQRETAPDRVVRAADEIELVDMSPRALRRRMAHGHIYKADKVDAALSNYFREGNLTALRSLALLWMADRVDEGMERYRSDHQISNTWATRDHIVVAVNGRPESFTLMRRAARLAAKRNSSEWQALFVVQPDGLVGVSPDRLAELRAKAEELGGTFHTVVGEDTPEAILDFAKAENASQIIVGISRRGKLAGLLRPGIGERVIDGSGEIDVLVVTHKFAGTALRPGKTTREDPISRGRRILGYLLGLLGPIAVATPLYLLTDAHSLAIDTMLLMAVVVATAMVGGMWPSIVASVGSGLFLNYFFTEPYPQWTIADPENALTIVLFVVVGVGVASFVGQTARRTSQARKARSEADALTALSDSLLSSSDDLAGLLSSASDLLGATGVSVWRENADGTEEAFASHGAEPHEDDPTFSSTNIDDRTRLVVTGVSPTPAHQRLLKAYAAYAKVVADRRAAAAAELDRIRLADADHTRTMLLAAVSHDLRTPLTALRAAVESLRATDIEWSPEDEAELLGTIDESATRLSALVGNLLDLSRIHTGAVTPTAAEVRLAPALRSVLEHLDDAERVQFAVDEGLTVLADPGLLDRVFANVVENALKYTNAGTPVRIDASVAKGRATVRVADSGNGVRTSDLDRLFLPFEQAGEFPSPGGVGLGLAVARGFTAAMNATIHAEDTPGGGLTFVIELPAPGAQGPVEWHDASALLT